jgi:hypothetical protein
MATVFTIAEIKLVAAAAFIEASKSGMLGVALAQSRVMGKLEILDCQSNAASTPEKVTSGQSLSTTPEKNSPNRQEYVIDCMSKDQEEMAPVPTCPTLPGVMQRKVAMKKPMKVYEDHMKVSHCVKKHQLKQEEAARQIQFMFRAARTRAMSGHPVEKDQDTVRRILEKKMVSPFKKRQATEEQAALLIQRMFRAAYFRNEEKVAMAVSIWQQTYTLEQDLKETQDTLRHHLAAKVKSELAAIKKCRANEEQSQPYVNLMAQLVVARILHKVCTKIAAIKKDEASQKKVDVGIQSVDLKNAGTVASEVRSKLGTFSVIGLVSCILFWAFFVLWLPQEQFDMVASDFAWDIVECASQRKPATVLSNIASACILCEEQSSWSSFALDVEACASQLRPTTMISSEAFACIPCEDERLPNESPSYSIANLLLDNFRRLLMPFMGL